MSLGKCVACKYRITLCGEVSTWWAHVWPFGVVKSPAPSLLHVTLCCWAEPTWPAGKYPARVCYHLRCSCSSQGLSNIMAADFDYRKEFIYWIDSSRPSGRRINRIRLNGSDLKVWGCLWLKVCSPLVPPALKEGQMPFGGVTSEPSGRWTFLSFERWVNISIILRGAFDEVSIWGHSSMIYKATSLISEIIYF